MFEFRILLWPMDAYRLSCECDRNDRREVTQDAVYRLTLWIKADQETRTYRLLTAIFIVGLGFISQTFDLVRLEIHCLPF